MVDLGTYFLLEFVIHLPVVYIIIYHLSVERSLLVFKIGEFDPQALGYTPLIGFILLIEFPQPGVDEVRRLLIYDERVKYPRQLYLQFLLAYIGLAAFTPGFGASVIDVPFLPFGGNGASALATGEKSPVCEYVLLLALCLRFAA